MKQIFVPTGRLNTKRREFTKVVADLRHAVFAVVRFRASQQQPGLFEITVLGSGFFVSPEVFITCWHVIDGPQLPHQPGDKYQLVANLGATPVAYPIGDIGTDIHLFPDEDLAIVICRANKAQAYLSVSYTDISVGTEIGVAGYPLAMLSTDASGNPDVKALVYRVAKGVATAVYRYNIDHKDGHPLPDREVVEVNFMFVPGNSGGPVFEADTGRVVAFVKGFRSHKIQELAEQCFPTTQVPAGLSNTYLDAVHAVYSIGLTLDRVRPHLEQYGVTL